MVAYVIAIRDEMLDPVGYAAYVPKGTAAFEGVDCKALATYGRFEVVEGAPAESVVILEFPTFEAAQAWYASPKNQEAIPYRKASARMRIMIVEGV